MPIMLTMEAQLKQLAQPFDRRYIKIHPVSKKPYFTAEVYRYALRRRAPHHSIQCTTRISGLYCVTDVTIEIACQDGVLVRSANGFEVFTPDKAMRGDPASNSYADAYKRACRQLGMGKASGEDGGDE